MKCFRVVLLVFLATEQSTPNLLPVLTGTANQNLASVDLVISANIAGNSCGLAFLTIAAFDTRNCTGGKREWQLPNINIHPMNRYVNNQSLIQLTRELLQRQKIDLSKYATYLLISVRSE